MPEQMATNPGVPPTSWRSRPVTASPVGHPLRPMRRSDPPPKPTGECATFLADVVEGLGRSPKALPAKYLFDAVGARLFACLVTNDAYYLATNELEILAEQGADIAAALGSGIQLVDLACGDGCRTSILAAHLQQPARIVLVDRLLTAASNTASVLAERYPDVPLLATDAHDPWSTHVPSFARADRTVAYLPSSLIGELEPREAKSELQRLRGECGPDGRLLVAIDLKKAAQTLERAYADATGVGAAFALNILARINRELAGSFQLAAFDTRASYDPVKGRVEMQLVSKRWQWAAVHGTWFNFGAGETITTLLATKYTIEWFTTVASSAGWNVERVFANAGRTYALVLLG